MRLNLRVARIPDEASQNPTAGPPTFPTATDPGKIDLSAQPFVRMINSGLRSRQ